MLNKLSVIVCTYNPKPEFFKQCLESIVAANKVYTAHEILIIDNNSNPGLIENDYVKRFSEQISTVKIIVEKEQGLTPARLCGIKASSGDILLFVDDDNFIAPDFFEKGLAIAANNTHIGSWSGQVKLVFEAEPETWARPYLGLLVHRQFTKDSWSNMPHLPDTMPCGAGLFVRKNVAQFYLDLHVEGKRGIQLDRKGNSLFSGGDNDLAACACDIGLGVGLFSDLELDHYIPAFRVTKEYLLKLAEGIAASTVVFKSFRGEGTRGLTLKNKIANSVRLILKSAIDKQFFKAVLRGEKSGMEIVNSQ